MSLYLSDAPLPTHGMQVTNTGIGKEFVKHSHYYYEESFGVLPVLPEEQVLVWNRLERWHSLSCRVPAAWSLPSLVFGHVTRKNPHPKDGD